jgi:hypothetical protein
MGVHFSGENPWMAYDNLPETRRDPVAFWVNRDRGRGHRSKPLWVRHITDGASISRCGLAIRSKRSLLDEDTSTLQGEKRNCRRCDPL